MSSRPLLSLCQAIRAGDVLEGQCWTRGNMALTKSTWQSLTMASEGSHGAAGLGRFGADGSPSLLYMKCTSAASGPHDQEEGISDDDPVMSGKRRLRFISVADVGQSIPMQFSKNDFRTPSSSGGRGREVLRELNPFCHTSRAAT